MDTALNSVASLPSRNGNREPVTRLILVRPPCAQMTGERPS
ncbi:hypothetical protein BRAS3843_2990008 [Bradyrhizobium sp. STM 3843]|nr:hypothetical protein BRAS3843_2990008 [Bradyrhizobium sp. STM 3843]